MIIRSYPKVNICFKITGFLGNYCEIASRFALVKSANLYDTIEIRQSDSLKISGNFDCEMSENTIFRAKEALKSFLDSTAESTLDSADLQNLDKQNLCEAPKTRPLRGAKNRNQGCSSATADFLLEAEKRGSPPKSEKAAAFWRVGGAGRGVQPFLREEKGDKKLKDSKDIIKQLETFCIEVDKKIPTFAGLGGGSSNAASYLIAMNEILDLNLEPKDLVQIARRVGADVSFFVCGFNSANVFGIGEGVEFFDEKVLELEFFTPPIQCSTKAVYDEYRAMQNRGEAHFYKNARELLANDSATLLQKNTINFLNDLYTPACKIYPQLRDFAKDGYFFSGSGSSFFRLKH